MTLEQIYKLIELEHPDWNWLVRRDTVNSYFANIYNHNSHTKFMAWGTTPSLALQQSLLGLELYLKGKTEDYDELIARSVKTIKNMGGASFG